MNSDISAPKREASPGKNNTPKDMAGNKFTRPAGTKAREGAIDYNQRSHKCARIK